MEKRLLAHRIEGSVEVVIVLILEVCRLACPERLDLVDYIVLFCIDILAVLPFLLLAEYHRHRHELAVFVEKVCDALLLSELFLLVIDVEGDDRTSVSLLAWFHLIFRRTVA